MNQVTLNKDGSIAHNGKTVETDPLPFLSFQVTLEEGFALRSFFRMLERYPSLVGLNLFFPTFLEKYHESPESGCEYPGIDCLELGKNVEMIGFPGKPRLEIYTTFLGIQGKDFVVGTVGWLLRIKGPMILMKAMAYVWRKYPDCHLVYVGKGDLEEEMRHEVDRMGVSDHVHFLGWRDDIPEIMPVFDVFVLPSLNEGMGRVLVEAMAAGRPVVASKVGGIVDIVKHGQNGLLVEPADVEGLGKAITELLENREGRVQMGNRGRQLAPHYSIERMIENLDTLYASLLGIR